MTVSYRKALFMIIVAAMVTLTAFYIVMGGAVGNASKAQSTSQRIGVAEDKSKLHKIKNIEIVIDDKLSKYYDQEDIEEHLMVIGGNPSDYGKPYIKTIKVPAGQIIKYLLKDNAIKFIIVAQSNIDKLSGIKFAQLKGSNIFIIIIDDEGRGLDEARLRSLGFPYGASSGGVMTEHGIEYKLNGAVIFGYPYGTFTGILYSMPPEYYDPLGNLDEIVVSAISNIDDYYAVSLPALHTSISK